jgi:hypothetical protein
VRDPSLGKRARYSGREHSAELVGAWFASEIETRAHARRTTTLRAGPGATLRPANIFMSLFKSLKRFAQRLSAELVTWPFGSGIRPRANQCFKACASSRARARNNSLDSAIEPANS